MHAITKRADKVVISGYEELDNNRFSLTDEILFSPSDAFTVAESLIVEALRLLKADERTDALSTLVTRVQLSVFGERTAQSDTLEDR